MPINSETTSEVRKHSSTRKYTNQMWLLDMAFVLQKALQVIIYEFYILTFPEFYTLYLEILSPCSKK